MIRPGKRLLILTTLLLVGVGTQARAAPAKSGGITVTPAFQELVLASGQKKLGGSLSVQNNANRTVAFELSAVDMGTLDDTGGLVFSGLPQDYQKKYGLANWLTLADTKLTVGPKKVATVAFTIKNDTLLGPGGHYGAVVIKQAAVRGSDKQVAVSPEAAALLLLKKRGGEVYGLSLGKPRADNSVWSLPTKVDLPFKNNGNVHVVPRGIVSVKNTFGEEVAKGIINADSSIILPERSRTLRVPLESWGKNIWPSKYRLEVAYRYDGTDKVTYVTQTFYTGNLRILLILVGSLLFLLMIGYIVWKRTYRWRRSLIQHS